jgi:hypothetical protein
MQICNQPTPLIYCGTTIVNVGHLILDLRKTDQEYCCFAVHWIFGSSICITWSQCCQEPYCGCGMADHCCWFKCLQSSWLSCQPSGNWAKICRCIAWHVKHSRDSSCNCQYHGCRCLHRVLGLFPVLFVLNLHYVHWLHGLLGHECIRKVYFQLVISNPGSSAS